MTPRRIEEIQKTLDDPEFLANRPVIQELVTAYRQELDRYNDAAALLVGLAKVRDELKMELREANFDLEMQSKELNAKAIHDALGEGEFCDVCTHLSAEQMDEIYERQEEEIRQLTEHNENLQKALDTLLNGLPGRG